MWAIECDVCLATNGGAYNSREQTIALWNRRTHDAELLEALKLARPYIPTGSNSNMSLRAKDNAKAALAKVDAAIAKASGAA